MHQIWRRKTSFGKCKVCHFSLSLSLLISFSLHMWTSISLSRPGSLFLHVLICNDMICITAFQNQDRNCEACVCGFLREYRPFLAVGPTVFGLRNSPLSARDIHPSSPKWSSDCAMTMHICMEGFIWCQSMRRWRSRRNGLCEEEERQRVEAARTAEARAVQSVPSHTRQSPRHPAKG